MSSPLQRLSAGHKPGPAQDRATMLSRLGIAEEKPRDLFREPPEAESAPEAEPEPAAQPALARAPEPAPEPASEPEPSLTSSWSLPANDEHIPSIPDAEPAPAPEPQPEPQPEVSFLKTPEPEDPLEAIRRQYRKAPSGLRPLSRPQVQLPKVQMPNVSLPNVQLPNVQLPNFQLPKLKTERAGARRRKSGELGMARNLIWGLSTLAAAVIAYALLTGDENNAIVQVFGLLLP